MPAFVQKLRSDAWMESSRLTGVSVHYDGEVSRNRRIMTVAMPFIVLTLGGFAGHLAFLKEPVGSMMWIIAWFNAAVSPIDLATLPNLLRLPESSILFFGLWRPKNGQEPVPPKGVPVLHD